MVWGSAQHQLVAEQHQLLPGPREGHVQLAVNLAAFIGRNHELELVLVVAAKTHDDNVALAALVALHGVDADLGQGRQRQLERQCGEARPNTRRLVAVAGNDVVLIIL